MEKLKERYVDLKAIIKHHMNLYYNEDTSEISDEEYDNLMRELKAIEASNSDWISQDSPTQIVGGKDKRENGVIVKHITPMLSIQDVFDKESLFSKLNDMRAVYPDIEFSVEEKIDGLSMTLRYHDGKLLLAETRGDGFEGEDVTVNAKVINDVKQTLPINEDFEIRGEVYMSHASFDELVYKAGVAGKNAPANPRNAAAGTLRVLDPNVTKERKLNMFIFNIQSKNNISFNGKHAAALDNLSAIGIPVVAHKVCKTNEEVWDVIQEIGARRSTLEYDIDGAVIKVNNCDERTAFPVGNGLKYAAGHIAYKYPAEAKTAIIKDVELTVGRTGKINPTAVFTDLNGKPVSLCGTSVSRATLHNQDFISALGLDIGAIVKVYKSGEIIPKIREVVKSTGTIFTIPDRCPVCGEPVKRIGAEMYCENKNCSSQLVNAVIYFASKDCMDIKGLGESQITALIEAGYIETFSDIYMLEAFKKSLITKGILGKEKGTENVLDAIEASKKNPPERLLAALGIPGIGRTAAKVIMKGCNDLFDLASYSVEDFKNIDGIGEIMSNDLFDYFHDTNKMDLLVSLRDLGINTKSEKVEQATTLTGLTFCITGTLPSMGRKEMSDMIESNGGKVVGSVSKKLNYLIAGDAAGSKLDKAKELGITIINENEFKQMI